MEVVEADHGICEPLAAFVERDGLDGHLVRVHDRAVRAVVHHHVQLVHLLIGDRGQIVQSGHNPVIIRS